jgi:hypothetical protein
VITTISGEHVFVVDSIEPNQPGSQDFSVGTEPILSQDPDPPAPLPAATNLLRPWLDATSGY